MSYSVTIRPTAQSLAIGWLWLGLGSLIIAGIFSILLVLSRVPQAQDFIPWLDFFHTSIVIHVDMSVLIWFLSYGCLGWTLTTRRLEGYAGKTALALAVSGTLIIGASPFLGAGDPLMNNYVPVLRHPLFFTGLILFGSGILIQVISGLRPDGFNYQPQENTLRLGIYLALLITLTAFISLTWSYLEVPSSADDHAYFEYLFWGAGHVVQFAYTLLMLVAWLWLFSALQLKTTASDKVIRLLLIAGAAPVLLAPLIHFMYGSFSLEYRSSYTLLMRYGSVIAPLSIGLLILFAMLKKQPFNDQQRPLHSALKTSILLFGAGGILGFLTHGVNTIIPAHYHGSIVGVTLAFMGLTYYLLPKLGYQQVDSKLARRQPWIYAWGQFIHISGLAVSGAMGIQRKTAGAAQGLDSMATKTAMGIMGLGGLIAIIGGILFLVVTLKIISRGRTPD